MRQRPVILCSSLVGSAVLAIATLALPQKAIAQSLSNCQPPRTGEYLLLVLNESEETLTQLQETLPPNASISVCNYLGREVSRVSGFDDPEVASSWAQYLTDIGGLQAFVAHPPDQTSSSATDPTVTAPSPPALPVSTHAAAAINPALADSVPTHSSAANLTSTSPAPTVTAPPLDSVPTAPASLAAAPSNPITAYNPQPLNAGYAVLVDYANHPEVAVEVKQLLSRDIGLVSYNQRPYLLALYTADPSVASAVLRTLSDRNFSALVVDSRRAVLLTPTVATP
jgi:hypothetical protein